MIREDRLRPYIEAMKTPFVPVDGEFLRLLEYYEEYRIGLLARSPAKIGDRVFLMETPVITKETANGWIGCEHFLVRGAVATIGGVDFYDGKFRFGLLFDNESYIHDGKTILVKDKGQYWFSEDKLARIGV